MKLPKEEQRKIMEAKDPGPIYEEEPKSRLGFNIVIPIAPFGAPPAGPRVWQQPSSLLDTLLLLPPLPREPFLLCDSCGGGGWAALDTLPARHGQACPSTTTAAGLI